MTDPNSPFPGARRNPMLLLGLPHRDIPANGHFTLGGDQAVTYATAKPVTPVTLKPGDSLYRVFGGAANPKGGFWAPTPPANGMTEADWRSSNAVMPLWNAGTSVQELTVKDGQSLQCWSGEIESQPAIDNAKNVVKDWFLVGGGTQFFVQFWDASFDAAVEMKGLGATPWTGGAHPAVFEAEESLNAALHDLNPESGVEAHVVAVSTLAVALRSTASLAQTHYAIGSDLSGALRIAANNLIGVANSILECIGSDDERAMLGVQSHLSLGRQIDLDPAWPQAAVALAALSQVISSAAALCQRT